MASRETFVAKAEFQVFEAMYDDIKSTGAQPVHKVKADRDERSEEPAGNVRLKGCLVCVEAASASSRCG